MAKTTYPTDEKGVLLYADPEADEAVAGYLNADEGVLELRHHALGLKTLDLCSAVTPPACGTACRAPTR